MILTLALAGCVGPDAENIEDRHEQTVAQMERHDAEAMTMRAALIDGNLEQVRHAAGELDARLPIHGMGDRLVARQAELKSIAGRLAGATTLQVAAAEMGELAVSCGSCHAQVGILPPPPSDEPNGEAW